MEFAFGVLHWSPSTFWSATFYELSCAYAGFSKANASPKDMDEDEIEALMQISAELIEQFPDGKIAKAEKRARAKSGR